MSSLRRLSTPDLQLLRAIILTVIDEGDRDGQPWALYENSDSYSNWTQESANLERLDFCDAIQQRIFTTTEPLPERKGGTDDA